jgi:hypothetical protein
MDNYCWLMSLTGMLERREMPLREFFESRLPNCKRMQKDWKTRGEPKILPSESVTWSLVGAAFDYRTRYFFTVTPPERFVAAYSASGELRRSFGNLAKGLNEFLATNPPFGVVLGLEMEEYLARFCYVLAMYESLFRAPIADSPLFSLRPNASVFEQLQLVPASDTADIVALTEAAAPVVSKLFGKPVIANPTFVGSGDVGGADADLIVGRCLIDINTTKSKTLDRASAYQLVGYLLLDYDDEFRIDEIGFYLSRIPSFVLWKADEAIDEMSNGHETLTGLRKSLKVFLDGLED